MVELELSKDELTLKNFILSRSILKKDGEDTNMLCALSPKQFKVLKNDKLAFTIISYLFSREKLVITDGTNYKLFNFEKII